MILATFMLAIASIVISGIAYINTNMLDEKFSNMIDHFDSIETQWRYDRQIIYNSLKLLKKNGKPKQDKKEQIVKNKRGRKNEKHIKKAKPNKKTKR